MQDFREAFRAAAIVSYIFKNKIFLVATFGAFRGYWKK